MAREPVVKAKVRGDGSIIVNLADPPGCLEVLTERAKIAVSYLFAFGLGVAFGIMMEVFGR